jgi:hypothetical protein
MKTTNPTRRAVGAAATALALTVTGGCGTILREAGPAAEDAARTAGHVHVRPSVPRVPGVEPRDPENSVFEHLPEVLDKGCEVSDNLARDRAEQAGNYDESHDWNPCG